MGGISGIDKNFQPLDLSLCREQTDALAHRDLDNGGSFWSCVASWAADAGLF